MYMDYKKIYNSIIERGLNRTDLTIYEKHHIVPRCLGGTDEPENLVKLTPEEHYVAHQLLVKIYPDNESIVFAAQMMVPNRPNNKMYGWLKRRYKKSASLKFKGKGNSQYGTCWITNGFMNKKILKTENIPSGWNPGRFIKKTKFSHECICVHCKKPFTANRKRKICTIECDRANRPDIVRDNFEALYKEYQSNGNVISKAFIACGIGYNNNTFARFKKYLRRVGSVATASVL